MERPPADSSGLRLLAEGVPNGPKLEEPISSEEYLHSLIESVLWIRAVAAASQLPILADTQRDILERLSAALVIQTQVALALEDQMTQLIAWSAWAKDKNNSLPDILARTSLRLGGASSRSQPADEVIDSLASGTKRVEVDAIAFFTEIASETGESATRKLGIPWKKSPSVKLVPAGLRSQWDKLPGFAASLATGLAQANGRDIAAIHNKTKHGPQMLMMKPAVAARRRGIIAEGPGADEYAIRLLLKGSTTQRQGGHDRTDPAPLLLAEPELAKRWVYNVIMVQSMAMSGLGYWLFRVSFPEASPPNMVKHGSVVQVLGELNHYLYQTGQKGWVGEWL